MVKLLATVFPPLLQLMMVSLIGVVGPTQQGAVACLRGWIVSLLIYQFWDGLNQKLYHNFLPRRVPNNLKM